MLNLVFLEKGLGLVSPPHFFALIFKKKFFACDILLTDKILCLIAFTSSDIGQ